MLKHTLIAVNEVYVLLLFKIRTCQLLKYTVYREQQITKNLGVQLFHLCFSRFSTRLDRRK